MSSLMMLFFIIFSSKSISLLRTEYLFLKSGGSEVYTLKLPEKSTLSLLVSGIFPQRTVIEVKADDEILSEEKGGEDVDYAVFTFSQPHREFEITIKNISDKDEEIKFYVDSSLVDIKEIPMQHGFFVKEFSKGEDIATVECVFPFRSSSRVWVKKVKKGVLEDALYTSLTYAENIALKKAEVKDEPGRYLIFAEVTSDRGFINCETRFQEMPVKKMRRWKGAVLLTLGGLVVLIVVVLFFVKRT